MVTTFLVCVGVVVSPCLVILQLVNHMMVPCGQRCMFGLEKIDFEKRGIEGLEIEA